MLNLIIAVMFVVSVVYFFKANKRPKVLAVIGAAFGFIVGSSTGIASGGGAVNGSLIFAVVFFAIGLLIGMVTMKSQLSKQ